MPFQPSWTPTRDGKLLPPCKLYEQEIAKNLRPVQREWTEEGMIAELKGATRSQRGEIVESVMALWYLKQQDEDGADDDIWPLHAFAWVHRHADLCRKLNIPPLPAVSTWATYAIRNGLLTEELKPLFEEDVEMRDREHKGSPGRSATVEKDPPVRVSRKRQKSQKALEAQESAQFWSEIASDSDAVETRGSGSKKQAKPKPARKEDTKGKAKVKEAAPPSKGSPVSPMSAFITPTRPATSASAPPIANGQFVLEYIVLPSIDMMAQPLTDPTRSPYSLTSAVAHVSAAIAREDAQLVSLITLARGRIKLMRNLMVSLVEERDRLVDGQGIDWPDDDELFQTAGSASVNAEEDPEDGE